MRRVLIGVATLIIWVAMFALVHANTAPTQRPCNDNFSIPVSGVAQASCAAPSPSVHPAVESATIAALLAGYLIARAGRST